MNTGTKTMKIAFITITLYPSLIAIDIGIYPVISGLFMI